MVELTYFSGHSYQEIAAIMQCPVNTVKTRMFHARRRLANLLPMLELSRTEQIGGEQMMSLPDEDEVDMEKRH